MRKKEFLQNVSLLACTLLIIFLILELWVRYFMITPSLVGLVKPDPDVEYTYVPNLSSTYSTYNVHKNPVHFNAQGLHDDHDYQLSKSSSTTRVALLGDSFVGALEVPIKDSMTHAISTDLVSLQPSSQYDLLNFGVSGYSNVNELEMFNKKALAYNPDVAVLFVYQNDIIENTADKAGAVYGKVENGVVHIVHNTSDSSDTPAHPPMGSSLIKKIIASSKLIGFAADQVQYIPSIQSLLVRLHLRKPFNFTFQILRPYKKDEEPAIRDGYTVAGYVINEMERAMHDRGGNLIVVYIPQRFELHTKTEQDIASANALPFDAFDFSLSRNQIKSYAEASGARFVDLTEAFSKEKENLYLTPDVHLTAQGHRIAAAQVAKAIAAVR